MKMNGEFQRRIKVVKMGHHFFNTFIRAKRLKPENVFSEIEQGLKSNMPLSTNLFFIYLYELS